MSRETADEKAAREFEIFSERRRVTLEAQAEYDLIRELEETARTLAKRPAKRKKKPKADES